MHLYAIEDSWLALKKKWEPRGTEGTTASHHLSCPALGHALTESNGGGAFAYHPALSCSEWVLASQVIYKIKYTSCVHNVSDNREEEVSQKAQVKPSSAGFIEPDCQGASLSFRPPAFPWLVADHRIIILLILGH